MAILGNKCAACGATENLEFDCREPVVEQHHGMDPSQRITFYKRQWRFGNLQILCGSCNAFKGGMPWEEWFAQVITQKSSVIPNTIIKAGEHCEHQRQALSPRGNGGSEL